jgi:hypothetical protein
VAKEQDGISVEYLGYKVARCIVAQAENLFHIAQWRCNGRNYCWSHLPDEAKMIWELLKDEESR